eukprot:scaffold7941_cov40-Cyclotella_meneghiniana.AAC.2
MEGSDHLPLTAASKKVAKNFFQFISQECSGMIQLSASLTASRHTYLLPPLHSNRGKAIFSCLLTAVKLRHFVNIGFLSFLFYEKGVFDFRERVRVKDKKEGSQTSLTEYISKVSSIKFGTFNEVNSRNSRNPREQPESATGYGGIGYSWDGGASGGVRDA